MSNVKVKQRRRSGRINIPGQYEDIENYVGHQVIWDDWIDYRDGQRNRYDDRTRLKHPEVYGDLGIGWWTGRCDITYNQINSKIKKHNLIRKAMKSGRTSCVI